MQQRAVTDMTDSKVAPPRNTSLSAPDANEPYPYSAADAIRPNSPLPSSLSHPSSNITTLLPPHPSHPSSSSSFPSSSSSLPPSDQSLSSTSSLLQTLVELTIDLRRMALEDHGKAQGTAELAQRMDELRAMLAEHTDLLFLHHSSAHLHTALLSLRTTLLSIHLILHKALATTFRRSAKFKQPIRISINDTVIGLAKLGAALSLAVATSSAGAGALGASASIAPLTLAPGQEESVLGDKYVAGHGLPVDYVKAAHLYSIAAEKGYAPAMTALAGLLREGKGGRKKDVVAALQWYKRALSLQDADAANALGTMWEAGEGVVRNLEVAIEHYQTAANLGHADAQCNLGYIYEHGSEDEGTHPLRPLIPFPLLPASHRLTSLCSLSLLRLLQPTMCRSIWMPRPRGTVRRPTRVTPRR